MSLSQAQIAVVRLEGVRLANWTEVTLIGGIVFAVLAFGGTEPASFALAQIVFAATAMVLLAYPRSANLHFSMGMLTAPLLLLSLIALQLCPLPASWMRGTSTVAVGDHSHFRTLAIEPFATRVHFLIVVTCVIAFFLGYVVSQETGGKRRLTKAIVITGLGEALYGLVQYLTGWQRIFGYEKKYDLQEATGTYINRNHYAGFLEMVLPLAFALAFYELWKLHKKSGTGIRKSRQFVAMPGVHKVVVWFAIAVVISAGLFYSRSRMGIASAFLSTTLVFVLAWGKRLYGRTGLIMCGVFVGLSISLIGWLGAESVVERFQNVAQEYPTTDHNRLSIWRDTFHLIGQHPWIGTGLGTFPLAYTAVQTTFLDGFVNHAHNDYLELASDIGIPAAVALAGCFLWLFIRTVRTSRSPDTHFERFLSLGCAGSLLAILLHSLADFNFYIPANALVFASILGISMSAQPRRSSKAI
jgi:O-antigen ligase